MSQRSANPAKGKGSLVLPAFSLPLDLRQPQVRQIERYPLGDYLYDRAKARHDLAMAKLRWEWYKLNLPPDAREPVEKIERLYMQLARLKSLTPTVDYM